MPALVTVHVALFSAGKLIRDNQALQGLLWWCAGCRQLLTWFSKTNYLPATVNYLARKLNDYLSYVLSSIVAFVYFNYQELTYGIIILKMCTNILRIVLIVYILTILENMEIIDIQEMMYFICQFI